MTLTWFEHDRGKECVREEFPYVRKLWTDDEFETNGRKMLSRFWRKKRLAGRSPAQCWPASLGVVGGLLSDGESYPDRLRIRWMQNAKKITPMSLLQKQRRLTEQYYKMCHIQRLYAICTICNMVSCVSARGSYEKPLKLNILNMKREKIVFNCFVYL